jgi:hypothetical protein
MMRLYQFVLFYCKMTTGGSKMAWVTRCLNKRYETHAKLSAPPPPYAKFVKVWIFEYYLRLKIERLILIRRSMLNKLIYFNDHR